MLNNTDNSDDNGKLPPIPTYCEQPSQPSQAEGVLDEALANSDRFVDEANLPAQNPTGMSYDHEGTERKNVYNDKGNLLPPPRFLEGIHQSCAMKGCKMDQTLVQLPCFGWDPVTHAKFIHPCCYQQKVLDKYDLVHPDPDQRRELMKYMSIAYCTKGCHTWYKKYVAGNNAGSLPMQQCKRMVQKAVTIPSTWPPSS